MLAALGIIAPVLDDDELDAELSDDELLLLDDSEDTDELLALEVLLVELELLALPPVTLKLLSSGK